MRPAFLTAALLLVGAGQSSAQTLAALKKAPCYMIDCPNAYITPLGKIPLTNPKPIYVKITVVQEALSPPPSPGAPWMLSTTYGFAKTQVEYVMPLKGATTYTINGLLPFDERGSNVSSPANSLGIQILRCRTGLSRPSQPRPIRSSSRSLRKILRARDPSHRGTCSTSSSPA
jgi:hypothetical protein